MTIHFDPDPIDRQIIEILHGDGRTSNRALGRQLGLSEAAIRKRLRRLTETGTITYGLLIDVSATNMRVFGWAYVEVHPSELSAAYRALAGMDRCSGCAMKTGSKFTTLFTSTTTAFSTTRSGRYLPMSTPRYTSEMSCSVSN